MAEHPTPTTTVENPFDAALAEMDAFINTAEEGALKNLAIYVRQTFVDKRKAELNAWQAKHRDFVLKDADTYLRARIGIARDLDISLAKTARDIQRLLTELKESTDM